MPVKKYNRKTKKFYIIKPKLIHIGSIKKCKNNRTLTNEEKYRISEFVDKVFFFGTEFGVKTIISTSNCDIFKIREEIKKNKNFINEKNIEKIKFKKCSNNIDKIKKQLGLYE